MRKKIIGILVCTLLIATAFPAVTSMENSKINAKIPNHPLINLAGNWSETQKFHALDGAKGKVFGGVISLDGDTVLIGAVLGDGNALNSGCAYVFTRSGTTWTQQAKLLPSDNTAGDWFAYCVSIDGDTALIGAQGDESGVDNGTAYVFTRSGTTWTLEQNLYASDGAAGDCFGFIVSLEGDTAIIGADWDDDNGENSGSAYVFTRSGTTWTQEAKLLASDGQVGDDFSGGAISLDGDTALISTGLDDDNGIDSGSAYVFTRSGTTWTQEAKLLPSDGAENDQFGNFGAVALEGDTALIGALYNDNDNGVDSGSAYVFIRTGTIWTQQQKIIAMDGAANDQFGVAVALEGNIAFIGAWFDDDVGTNSGSAYVLIKTENQPPGAPTITGPNSGKVGNSIEYKFNATDPDGDQVKYIINWGDGKTDTTALNPSGSDMAMTHTWSKKGEYAIKVQAQDEFGLIGLQSTRTVTMPRDRALPWNSLMMKVLEHFPLLEKILNL